jgi:hypothetical protein
LDALGGIVLLANVGDDAGQTIDFVENADQKGHLQHALIFNGFRAGT